MISWSVMRTIVCEGDCDLLMVNKYFQALSLCETQVATIFFRRLPGALVLTLIKPLIHFVIGRVWLLWFYDKKINSLLNYIEILQMKQNYLSEGKTI